MKKEETRFADSLIFEGMTSLRACITAWENGISDRKIERVYFDKAKEKTKSRELGYLKAMRARLGFDLVFCDGDEIEAKTVGSTHGGIIAECTARTIPTLGEAMAKKSLHADGFYVMLEGIEDPYNFGYALRSLYACGADGVILTPRNWMSAAGVVCRSSAGASELLPLYESTGEEAVGLMKKEEYRVLAAGIRNSVSSFECDMSRPLFLIIGGEKRGISRTILDLADEIVRIDYAAQFGGSLSTASAAAILAYEVMCQGYKTT